jgi:hypothetical protein
LNKKNDIFSVVKEVAGAMPAASFFMRRDLPRYGL